MRGTATIVSLNRSALLTCGPIDPMERCAWIIPAELLEAAREDHEEQLHRRGRVEDIRRWVMKIIQLLNKTARGRATSVVLTFAIVVTGTSIGLLAADNAKLWTTVAAAGTVDEDDLSIFGTNDRNIWVSTTKVPATLDVRYNIVAVDGLVPPENLPTSIFMKVRYRDQGSAGQIILRLRRYNLDTGSTTTMLTFDSDTVAQSSGQQVQLVETDPCSSDVKFDFLRNAYHIDAQLIQTGLSIESPPLLAIIQVGAITNGCPPK